MILILIIDIDFSFKNAFHRIKRKKLEFLKIDFNIKVLISTDFMFDRNFLSFANSFFINN